MMNDRDRSRSRGRGRGVNNRGGGGRGLDNNSPSPSRSGNNTPSPGRGPNRGGPNSRGLVRGRPRPVMSEQEEQERQHREEQQRRAFWCRICGNQGHYVAECSDTLAQDAVDVITPDPVKLATEVTALRLTSVVAPVLSADAKRAVRKQRDELRKQNLEKWGKAGLHLAKRILAPVSRPEVGRANFLKLEFRTDPGQIDLLRYRIEIPEINDKIPTKNEVRRALILRMLVENPPTLNKKFWVTDYYSYIISRGKLYTNIGDEAGVSDLDVSYYRNPTHEPNEPRLLTKIVFEGKVDLPRLIAHVTADSNNLDQDYLPDADLRSLNIVSWYQLHRTAEFNGGIVGKKFYPANQDENHSANVKTADKTSNIFLLRAGFFTSVRPGQGSLLLNVNTTTSAFFPSIVLSRWMQCRWPRGTTFAPELRVLKGVRVTFEGDTATARSGRKYVICEATMTAISNKFITHPKTKARIRADQYLTTNRGE
ncbi:uncharacterized protein LY89DRAFT_432472 [Mollisia scopiformis]|uniref:CCHC-type domain-containing protein n=1 Tax=Mollisia scopiformis TaxID=149040 RepID=A0A194XNP4_MOLSC|nr:uncharacterized protein LY89DRAFT_432472 [Mollisia scopiformis]KUJ21352.1 hypothetical protein LY89DRAFT_432472 [Mollisia scopiformis]